MLILTRQVGEAIMIGHDVTLRVLEIKGSYVRLGIEAPRNIPVYREEIYASAQAKHQRPDLPEPPPSRKN